MKKFIIGDAMTLTAVQTDSVRLASKAACNGLFFLVMNLVFIQKIINGIIYGPVPPGDSPFPTMRYKRCYPQAGTRNLFFSGDTQLLFHGYLESHDGRSLSITDLHDRLQTGFVLEIEGILYSGAIEFKQVLFLYFHLFHGYWSGCMVDFQWG